MGPRDSTPEDAGAEAAARSGQDLPRQDVPGRERASAGAAAGAGSSSSAGAGTGGLTRGVAVHVVGESDLHLGKAGPEKIQQRLAELRPHDVQDSAPVFAETPVGRFVAVLARKAAETGAPPADRVVLLAATEGKRATAGIATVLVDHVREMIRSSGIGIDSSQVTVERIQQPTTAHAREWTRGFLTKNGGAEQATWMLGLGAGATGVFLGVLFELLIRRIPVELWPEDGSDTPIDPCRPPSEEEVRRWLVRHRYYDALAALDPQTWEPLAQRQAVDVEALLTRACGPSANRCWPLEDAEDSTARRVLTEAVYAAFAEGLARQEITDGAAARAWLSRLVAERSPDDLREQIAEMLGLPPGRPGPRKQRALDPSVAARVGEPLASILREDVVRWHQTVKANSHGALARLAEPPPSVVALQNERIRAEHARGPLAAYPPWPVGEPLPEHRRVVLLRAAGITADREREVVDKIVDWLGTSNILAVEIATPQAVPPIPHSSMTTVRVTVVDKDVVRQPGLAARYRQELWDKLLGLPDAELADEVAVVLTKGPKAMSTAAMLAAVDWSLHIAARLRLLALDGEHDVTGPAGTRGVRDDDDGALAPLGMDEVLAWLAEHALRALDLTVAARLLDRGSARLRALACKVRALQRDAFGVLEPSRDIPGAQDRTSAAEIALAPARLRLCAQIAGAHPWDAAYLASSVLDHTFRMPAGEVRTCTVPGIGPTVLTKNKGWVPTAAGPEPAPKPRDWKALFPWEEIRLRQPLESSPSSMLRTWRNEHPLAHGLETTKERRSPKKTVRPCAAGQEVIRVPSADEIRALIRDAEQELVTALREAYPPESYPQLYGRDPDGLVRRHEELLAEAARLAAVIPAARAANGSQSAT